MCPITLACSDKEVRKKIAGRGYTINDETCILTLPKKIVKTILHAIKTFRIFTEMNDPDRAHKIHFLPQTQEAEEMGLICSRRLNRDPRDCDGFDCPLETYNNCIEILMRPKKCQNCMKREVTRIVLVTDLFERLSDRIYRLCEKCKLPFGFKEV